MGDSVGDVGWRFVIVVRASYAGSSRASSVAFGIVLTR
jgi:hypothetical protein